VNSAYIELSDPVGESAVLTIVLGIWGGVQKVKEALTLAAVNNGWNQLGVDLWSAFMVLKPNK